MTGRRHIPGEPDQHLAEASAGPWRWRVVREATPGRPRWMLYTYRRDGDLPFSRKRYESGKAAEAAMREMAERWR